MKKNLIACIAGALLSAVCLTGCANGTKSAEGTVDERFMKAASESIEIMWDQIENDDLDAADFYTEKHKEAYLPACEAELEKVEEFRNQQFEDEGLQEKAYEFIDALQNRVDALNCLPDDFSGYVDLWMDTNNTITEDICAFAFDYGMEVSDEYQETLQWYYDTFRTE